MSLLIFLSKEPKLTGRTERDPHGHSRCMRSCHLNRGRLSEASDGGRNGKEAEDEEEGLGKKKSLRGALGKLQGACFLKMRRTLASLSEDPTSRQREREKEKEIYACRCLRLFEETATWFSVYEGECKQILLQMSRKLLVS